MCLILLKLSYDILRCYHFGTNIILYDKNSSKSDIRG